MASITIRNLDPVTKQALRERAARNGHSMEEEARILLAAAENDRPDKADAPATIVQLPRNTEIPGRGNAITGIRGKRILLIISGGIAAYKSLELIRRLREFGGSLHVIMTKAAREFITPLSVEALAHNKVFTELFDRQAEHDIGHIALSRQADLIVVAPATADLMAKMANGSADDLASTVLLATDKPVVIAPAMNPRMWAHSATQRNTKTLKRDGIHFIGPGTGEMAEANETGLGRMAEPLEIVEKIGTLLDTGPKPLAGKRAIITSGPTHEPIDPVRYIANRSSGKQGHAIAEALGRAGAEVILVSGPVSIADPEQAEVIHVETALDMRQAVEAALPADIAVMVAAVADWRSTDTSDQKMKKQDGKGPAVLQLTENPDILSDLGHHKNRPALLIGFAAETQNLEAHAKAKLKRKNADWILANDVSKATGVMGGDQNTIKLVKRDGVEDWPKLDKQQVAERLVVKIIDHFKIETLEA